MGIHARNNNDRLRTVWTPEMDRYFIDLMLEQVTKGNRVDDNLFSKRAWKHMILLFNAKFSFQHEKDVLKNRHKSLRNLYKAIKNLLDQTGFYWDETRQMVTADNNIWDEYIKVHPDARSYRIKSIPYYRDLCIIYGNSSNEHKGNGIPELPAHSMDSDIVTVMDHNTIGEDSLDPLPDITIDDFRISVPEGVADNSMSETLSNVVQFNGGSRTRTYWQPSMDRYFIELMLDQVHRGNQVDGVFLKQAWIEMVASFNAKFGFNYEADILKNRYKTLRRQHNVIKNLLEFEGFSWDDSRKMVTADDHIWQDYINTHTDARQFMTRPVPHYKDLCMICRNPSFDDTEFLLSQNMPVLIDELNDQRPSKSFESSAPSASHDEEDGSPHEREKMIPKRQPEHYQELDHNCKRARSQVGLSSLPSSDTRKEDENCSIEEVIEAVQALPDMDDELILDACDLLEDEKRAKTFMALDVKLRKKWLLRKLRT